MIKKLLLIVVFCGLFITARNVLALTVDIGCWGTEYSTKTGNKCGKVLGEAIDATDTIKTKADFYDDRATDVDQGIISNTKKSITLISPNGGEVYQNGQQITVKWKSQDIPADTLLEVNIYSTSPQVFGFLAPNGTPNDGVETFTLSSLPNGSNYIIVVGVPFAGLNNSALSVKDESDAPFTINDGNSSCVNNSRQSITVVSPNGGESYTPGQQVSIDWKTCRIPSNTRMRIDLVMQRQNGTTITRLLRNNTLNDGTELVTLPTNTSWSQMVYGNNFKVRIRKINSTTPQDLSDSNFSIDNSIPSVTVATDPTTPAPGTVIVNNTASTLDIKLLKFKVEAKNSDIELRKIPIQITVSSNSNVSNIISTLRIIKDNNVVDTLDGTGGTQISTCTAGSVPCLSTYRFIFDDLSAPYNKVLSGTTSTFTISVDLKKMLGNYAERDSLTASITNADVLSASSFSVVDINGNQLPLSQRFGSAQGQTQILATTCANVVMGNTTNSSTVDSNGNVTAVTYTIPLNITSCGNTIYLGQSAHLALTASSSNAFAYAYNVSTDPTTPNIYSPSSSVFTSFDAPVEGTAYRIDEGATRHFTLTITLITPSIPNSSYRVQLRQIRTFNSSSMFYSGAVNTDLLPPSSYQTPYVFINN